MAWHQKFFKQKHKFLSLSSTILHGTFKILHRPPVEMATFVWQKIILCSREELFVMQNFSQMHSGMFRKVLFPSENVDRQRDFTHFYQWIESFFNPIEFLGLNKVNWVEKSPNSCKKMSKICKITLSADVFTTKQNLGKPSTVHRASTIIMGEKNLDVGKANWLAFLDWHQLLCQLG